ncbi:hypothetical protein BJY52DRAFT_1198255 [Lactarius psammicola]|nr:hypothetical protein BJY52DRAFT_1198255 [Lactarius psammicola]
MPGNEDRNSSGFSASSSPEASSSVRSMGLVASDQEEHGDDRSAVMDTTPPPLGVNLTCYRLLNVTIVFSFGITKGILTYMGRPAAPTTLDWVAGALLAVVLYWIGLYEQRNPRKWEWFFQVDLAPGIGYFTKRVVGGVMGLLFSRPIQRHNVLLGSSLGNLAVLLLDRSTLHVPLGALIWVFLSSLVGVVSLWYWVGSLIQPGRVWGWQRAMRFMDDYGPDAPLAERYSAHGLLTSFPRPNL